MYAPTPSPIMPVNTGAGFTIPDALKPPSAPSSTTPSPIFKTLTLVLGLLTVGLLASTITLAVLYATRTTTTTTTTFASTGPAAALVLGANECAGTDVNFPNIECFVDGVRQALEQAGANVTSGYTGEINATDHAPIDVPYYQAGLCPVNVHWHLGTEHLSVGQYDEEGTGPSSVVARREAAGKAVKAGSVRGGYQCRHYDASDAQYTTAYNWQHCVNMEVGQTYEVHWPHSAAGACGTVNQYQYPFYDGVFCKWATVGHTTHRQIGVQAQIFTVVNNESHYHPDLISGMIVGGQFGADMGIYTGSTTGTSRSNTICSQYTPITWQVDRTCHLISASSFDKMCADMKAVRDDMTYDLEPHGSRELVISSLVADNQVSSSFAGGSEL